MISMVSRPVAEGGGRAVGGGGKLSSSGEELSQRVGQMAFLRNEVIDARLILTLSRAIDSAVTDNERPAKAHELAQLVKKVYERRGDSSLQPAIMVLMFAIKNACINAWFQRSDADAFLTFYNEMLRCFASKESIDMDVNIALPLVTQVTSRFYPHLRVDHVIFSMEAKPGYNVLVTDFYIQRTLENISDQRICLFVSQVDNLETSSCITTPSDVNFLINGLGVNGRNLSSMDTGPQVPTDVTHLLKVGTNLLQAIGTFTGSYLIAIAVMVPSPTPDATFLKEYTTPAISTVSSDDEIIEGTSRISLICPISHQRIKTPVKGKDCKHIKCFDYSNFMEINLTRPIWRCPHCSQPTISTDLRIDQNMLKVLTEVEHDVSSVLFSTDGSWKPYVVKDTDSVVDKGTGLEYLNEKRIQDPCTNSPGLEAVDRKPPQDILDRLVHTHIHSGTSYVHPSVETSQGPDQEMTRDIWLMPTPSNYVPNSCAVPAVPLGSRTVSQPISTYSSGNTISVPTDAIMPTALLDGQGIYQPTLNPLPCMSPGIEVAAEGSSVHHPRTVGNAITESTRFSIPRNVTRAPLAVQALPAQGQQSALSRARISLNNSNVASGLASPSSVTVNPDIVSMGMERHQLVRQQTTLLGGSEVSSSPVPVRSNLQERQHHPNQPHQSVVGLPPLSQAGSRSIFDHPRMGSAPAQVGSFQGQQSMHYQPNVRFPQTMHPGTVVQQVPAYPSLLVHQFTQSSMGLPTTSGVSLAWRPTTNQQNFFRQNDMANATPASNHMRSTRPPGLPIPRSVDNSRLDQQWNSSSVPTPGIVALDMAYEQDLRPGKRMRGSVSLRSVHDRINPGLVSQQQQQQQHALQGGQRIPSPVASQLPTVIANNMMAHTSESHARTGNPAG